MYSWYAGQHGRHIPISGGAQGAVVEYLPCMHMQKSIFISPAFSAANAALVAILRRLLVLPECKWQTIDSLAAWLRLQVHRQNTAKYPQPVLMRHKYFMTLDLFLQHILRIDHGRTALGIRESA